jgi:uncharacterized membrane protein YkvA (DUF1232 family)
MKVLNQVVRSFVRSNIRNPKFRWFFILASLAYLISPLDISPDVFPVMGLLDDGLLVAMISTEISQFVLERRKANRNGETTVDVSAS